jgi:putative serine protease PepD
LLVAVAALTVAGGAGSGAVAAALVAHAAPAAAATVATTTTVQGTSSSATAESVYAQVSPGVVTITSVVGRGQAIGSGIVLDTKGDILTNAHVIAGAQQMQVTLSSGQTVAATLVGSNSSADLAVIRISWGTLTASRSETRSMRSVRRSACPGRSPRGSFRT